MSEPNAVDDDTKASNRGDDGKPNRRPYVLVLPGGGYSMHSPHEEQPVVDWLISLGFESSAFLYPVKTRHPAPLEAVRGEIRRIRDAGAERIAVLGFSAGGHAAGHAALAPSGDPLSVPDAAVLCYPVVSMQMERHTGSRENLIGLDASDDLRATTSLDALVTPDAPPFFLWHTADDASVPVEHSYRLAQALADAEVPHELHVFPHGRHGLGLSEELPHVARWTALCERWFADLGWLER